MAREERKSGTVHRKVGCGEAGKTSREETNSPRNLVREERRGGGSCRTGIIKGEWTRAGRGRGGWLAKGGEKEKRKKWSK